MSAWRDRAVRLVWELWFRDHARPVEWISLLMLAGWAQFLLSRPEEFVRPQYIAFHALTPNWWAAIIVGVVVAQIFAMWPSRFSPTVRFLAMALAAGLWTVIAIAFWSTEEITPVSARITSVLPLATIVTGVYLGAASWRQ